MRMIFEENIERGDFFEIILTAEEYYRLLTEGVVKEFANGLSDKRYLNVYIRVDLSIKQEKGHATSEGSESQDEEGILRKYPKRDGSGKTTEASGRNRVQRSRRK